jgi:hypothetical protein
MPVVDNPDFDLMLGMTPILRKDKIINAKPVKTSKIPNIATAIISKSNFV